MPVVMPQFGNLVNISDDTLERRKFIYDFLFAAISSHIKTYPGNEFNDYYVFNIDSMNSYSKKEILDIAARYDTMKVIRSTPPYNKVDTVICAVKNIENISMLRFYEKWMIDPKTMDLQKEVIALSPCETAYNSKKEFKGIRLLFTAMFGKAFRCFKE